jgi:nitronate monooxygenase
MTWPDKLQPMSLPVIGAPMFIISNPDLIAAQCVNGVIGAFPALNARPQPALGDWLSAITARLGTFRRANPGAEVAPFAVNQIIHASNDRLEKDLALCEQYKVPIIIRACPRRARSYRASMPGEDWYFMTSSICATRKKPQTPALTG